MLFVVYNEDTMTAGIATKEQYAKHNTYCKGFPAVIMLPVYLVMAASN